MSYAVSHHASRQRTHPKLVLGSAKSCLASIFTQSDHLPHNLHPCVPHKENGPSPARLKRPGVIGHFISHPFSTFSFFSLLSTFSSSITLYITKCLYRIYCLPASSMIIRMHWGYVDEMRKQDAVLHSTDPATLAPFNTLTLINKHMSVMEAGCVLCATFDRSTTANLVYCQWCKVGACTAKRPTSAPKGW